MFDAGKAVATATSLSAVERGRLTTLVHGALETLDPLLVSNHSHESVLRKLAGEPWRGNLTAERVEDLADIGISVREGDAALFSSLRFVPRGVDLEQALAGRYALGAFDYGNAVYIATDDVVRGAKYIPALSSGTIHEYPNQLARSWDQVDDVVSEHLAHHFGADVDFIHRGLPADAPVVVAARAHAEQGLAKLRSILEQDDVTATKSVRDMLDGDMWDELGIIESPVLHPSLDKVRAIALEPDRRDVAAVDALRRAAADRGLPVYLVNES